MHRSSACLLSRANFHEGNKIKVKLQNSEVRWSGGFGLTWLAKAEYTEFDVVSILEESGIF